MLSIERCRQILGKRCRLTDSELEVLRDQLYGLADVAVEIYLEMAEPDNSATSAARTAREAVEGHEVEFH